MKKNIIALLTMTSLSVFAQDYNCTLSLKKDGSATKLLTNLRLPIDGFGERVSVPNKDLLDIRLFKVNGDLGVRLASMFGFPYPSSQTGQIEQIRTESVYATGTKKIQVSLQVPKMEGGANTYLLNCSI